MPRAQSGYVEEPSRNVRKLRHDCQDAVRIVSIVRIVRKRLYKFGIRPVISLTILIDVREYEIQSFDLSLSISTTLSCVSRAHNQECQGTGYSPVARGLVDDKQNPFSHHDTDRLVAALSPADQAFRDSEARWGVARLERLVSPATLLSYRKGWTLYRAAIDEGDAAAVERLAPKMVAALRAMDAEATAAGHAPLSVERWETPLADGRVLVLVRTQAEAHAIAREPKDGRETVVWTLAEVGRMVARLDGVNEIKLAFPGAEAVRVSGVQMSENQVADWANDDPLYEILHG
jgi:hypothetical protein